MLNIRQIITIALAEGYHNALQKLFMCSHPNIWKFMRGIEKDIARHRLTIEQAGVANPEKQRPKYKKLAERLSAKIAEYPDARNKVKYLKQVAQIAYGSK